MVTEYDISVIFGGVSSENEVSVITGTMACNVLKKGGKSFLPVYITQEGEMLADERLADIALYKEGRLGGMSSLSFVRGGALILNARGKVKARAKIGVILNCCHGGDGEGGAIAALAALSGIPFASAGLFESAAFMDKYLTKLILSGLGVGIVPYVYARSSRDALSSVGALGYPVIVKPSTLGSSIGISRADDEESLSAALDVAFSLDSSVIIERYVSPRREINCAAYYEGGKVVLSPCEEVFTSGDLLSYSDKYSGGGRRQFPADLDEESKNFILNQTARVYGALNMRGIVRFDYIMCGKDIYISEINTVPGSLSQYLVSADYFSFCRVLEKIIATARADFAEKTSKRIIRTGILNNIVPNACKIK